MGRPPCRLAAHSMFEMAACTYERWKKSGNTKKPVYYTHRQKSSESTRNRGSGEENGCSETEFGSFVPAVKSEDDKQTLNGRGECGSIF